MTRRRRPWTWFLVIAFVLMPLLEIYVLIQVAQVIGGGMAFLLLIAGSVLGGWLVKREGTRAWRELVATVQEGRSPHRELADGAVVLAAGTLLLVPGFVTDVVGVILWLPFIRPLTRRVLSALIAKRLLSGGITAGDGYVAGGFGPGFGAGFGGTSWNPQADTRRPVEGDVVQGKVVDDD